MTTERVANGYECVDWYLCTKGVAMACVSTDGTLTASGRAILEAVRRPASAQEVAEATGLPLCRVRSGLREMAAAGPVPKESGGFSTRSA